MSKRCLTLVLGAFEPEVAHLREAIRAEQDVFIDTCGVGLVDAGIGCARSIEKLKTRLESDDRTIEDIRVVYVGSVGAYAASDEELDSGFVRASRVSLLDSAVCIGDAFFPSIMEVSCKRESADEPLLDVVPSDYSIIEAPVYSTLAITRSEALGKLLSEQHSARFESLELFAIARCCNIMSIPWDSIMPITNAIGPSGHKQWLAIHEKKANLLGPELLFSINMSK